MLFRSPLCAQGQRRPDSALYGGAGPGGDGGAGHGGEAEGPDLHLCGGVLHVLQQALQDPHRSAQGPRGLRGNGGYQPDHVVLGCATFFL